MTPRLLCIAVAVMCCGCGKEAPAQRSVEEEWNERDYTKQYPSAYEIAARMQIARDSTTAARDSAECCEPVPVASRGAPRVLPMSSEMPAWWMQPIPSRPPYGRIIEIHDYSIRDDWHSATIWQVADTLFVAIPGVPPLTSGKIQFKHMPYRIGVSK